MQRSLHAVTDELRRLKASGVKTVSVSDESVAALRRAMAKTGSRRSEIGTPAPSGPAASAVPAIKPYTPPPPAIRDAAPAPTPVPPAAPFTLPAGDKPARLAALRTIVLGDPVCVANVRPGKKIVVGTGSLDAQIFFVGEAPGAEEEVQGEPFVGPAGQLLTKMIGAMGLKREEVYIGNIMNWRPQMPVDAGGVQYGNRPPTEDELRHCLPYLLAQIEIVQPALLVALGSTAAQGLLGSGTFKTLGEIRGQWREFAGRPLMVTYHPSYILRSQSNRSKRMIWEDLLQVMERAALPIAEKQRGFFLEK